VFTAPVEKAKAADIASYKLESYRYEYTGAYGSPELDRATVKVEKVEVAADGKSVELTTAALVKDRVYLVSVPGVPLRDRRGAGASDRWPTRSTRSRRSNECRCSRRARYHFGHLLHAGRPRPCDRVARGGRAVAT